MPSVAAKLVAHIAATRLAQWAPNRITEEQNGFRNQRAIDGAHPVARRVIEEVVIFQRDKRVAVTCSDAVRAYSRVCRHALWQLLDRLGVPIPFIQVVKLFMNILVPKVLPTMVTQRCRLRVEASGSVALLLRSSLTCFAVLSI